jgi:acetyl esterase
MMKTSRLAWCALGRVAAAVLGLTSIARGQQPKHEFTYKQTAQGPLQLIVEYPDGWKTTDARPAVVFFFGGGWVNGSIDHFSRQAKYLAERGLVTVRADYRVASTHHTEPDAAVEDAQTALRWVRSHAKELGVDPNRIVAAGGSSGGHLAACTAQCPVTTTVVEDTSVSPRPNALLLFNPALDYAVLAQRLSMFPALMRDTALQRRISPVAHVARGDPPALLLFGTADSLLIVGQSYIQRMQAVGTRAELYTADGVGHGFFNQSPWYERTLYRADEFLASLGYTHGAPTIVRP